MRDTPAFPDVAGFVQHLREPGLPPAVISPRRFCHALNVDLKTLAAWARVHRNTVQRAPGSEALQNYLRDALRVIHAAIGPDRGIEATLFWFRNEPLPGFAFETPAQVLSTSGATLLLSNLVQASTFTPFQNATRPLISCASGFGSA